MIKKLNSDFDFENGVIHIIFVDDKNNDNQIHVNNSYDLLEVIKFLLELYSKSIK